MLKYGWKKFSFSFITAILTTYGIMELIERQINIQGMYFIIIPIIIAIMYCIISYVSENKKIKIKNKGFGLTVRKGDIYSDSLVGKKLIIFWGNECYGKSSMQYINKDSPLCKFLESKYGEIKKITPINKEFNYDVYSNRDDSKEFKYIVFKVGILSENKEIHLENEFDYLSKLNDMLKVASIEEKGHEIIIPNVGGHVKVNNENISSQRRLDLLVNMVIVVFKNQNSKVNIYINKKHKLSDYKLNSLKNRIIDSIH